ncbi:MAG: hypothetical protein ACO1PM_25345 [Acidovorax sp.]
MISPTLVLSAIVTFALSLAAANWTSSAFVSGVIVIAGAGVTVVMLFLPAFDRADKGRFKLGPNAGVEIVWDVRNTRPHRTAMPAEPTNSTKNKQAIKLCEEGRNLIRAKTQGEPVNLEKALSLFVDAAKLDDAYWEPRINIAQIYLLQGKLQEAHLEAETIRLAYADIPLAFAKAGLIVAKVIEQRISDADEQKTKRLHYRRIVKILQGNIEECKEHLTSWTSLGRALVLSGASPEKMKEFLADANQVAGFRNEFIEALKRDNISVDPQKSLAEMEFDHE